MAKVDKEASKKVGITVVRSEKPKAEAHKKKSWEKKIEKEEETEVKNDFVRDED